MYDLILPSKGHVPALIISEAHIYSAHASVKQIINELRVRYWICQARRSVQSIVSKCIPCKRYSSRPQEQVMADLPLSRIQPFESPFLTSGADTFGPFYVRLSNRTTHKRWIVLYCCHSSRAIHCEIIHKLDVDSFINAARRFQARRGEVPGRGDGHHASPRGDLDQAEHSGRCPRHRHRRRESTHRRHTPPG